jgi:hypothetical protein
LFQWKSFKNIYNLGGLHFQNIVVLKQLNVHLKNENKNFKKKRIYSFEGINEIWLKNLTSVGKI